MATTPPLRPTVRLPITLAIGEHSVQAGTLTLTLGEPAAPQIRAALHGAADALHQAADNLDDEHEEVGPE